MLALPSSAFDDPDYYMSHYGNLRHVEACVLMYDVGSRESFQEMQRHYEEFVRERSLPRRGAFCTLLCSPSCPPRPTPFAGHVYVVAHKIDREAGEWTVEMTEGEVFARSLGAEFFAASSKTGEGCGKAKLRDLTLRALLKRTRSVPPEQSPASGSTMGSRDAMTNQEGRYWY